MKQYIIIILIAFHLASSSAYATKTFLNEDHLHNYIHKCAIHIHGHHHSHNGFNHQHKHSHSQININYADMITNIYDMNLYDFENLKQAYLETAFWIPNPTLESLFRPPKI
ncbi:hypothetical protein SMGD1_0072 [Sulfurimonas gotlandica GD1]|uniref:Uncharacterized protein n=1 Tax=Sulfurimonas gotlandica (strain DSM 19862 / JCM 16533 / GD1) TaxID=929558 RepID=B6BLE4_SULGG|nr:hypothetical protein [Sulfurimonas gotlandica]EDZ62022.1 hypothetical protein CBGD1_2601 [Sulfurimonas gotlandica GD1]EHP28599.1 hypothetical protein SMGD1_0072 [Sulfurimonas gotlandica GD1]